MTNTKLLKIVMLENEISQIMIADYLHITKQSVYRKVNGLSEWKGSEIEKVSALLNLSNMERNLIFFDE